jgi:hypothetical protein
MCRYHVTLSTATHTWSVWVWAANAKAAARHPSARGGRVVGVSKADDGPAVFVDDDDDVVDDEEA